MTLQEKWRAEADKAEARSARNLARGHEEAAIAWRSRALQLRRCANELDAATPAAVFHVSMN